MPHANADGVSIHYEVDGDGPPVVFCGDVGLGAWQFGWQHGAVAGPFTAITPEWRGIGESDRPTGPYSLSDFVGDLEAVLSAEGVRNPHLVGYGFGGMVALQYALGQARPESLTLLGTPPSGADLNADGVWGDPNNPGEVRSAIDAGLSAEFREERPDVLDQIEDWRTVEDADQQVFEWQQSALNEFDVGDQLFEITTPTLVCHGSDDRICPVEYGEALADGLPRGEFVEVYGAGHLVGVEASGHVNDELRSWLDEHADVER